MKKWIALLLVLAMCAALYGCGVDEKYKALLECLDTGDYAGIKAELSLLSPDFRAEQEQMTADGELLEKYADLIASLEAGDYETAVENIRARMPVPEEPVYEEVAITMDNWQEYFEIRPYEEFNYNDFGDLVYMRTGYAFYLKAEYLPLLRENGADVSFRVGVTAEYWEVDIDTGVRLEGGSLDSVEQEEITPKAEDLRTLTDSKNLTCTASGQVAAVMVCGTGLMSADGQAWQGYYTDDFDVRDVIGTLMLAQ